MKTTKVGYIVQIIADILVRLESTLAMKELSKKKHVNVMLGESLIDK